MMTTTTKREPPPSGATVRMTITIDQDMWRNLEDEGVSDKDIERRICKALSSLRTSDIADHRAPIFDIVDCELLKYY